MFTFSNQKDKNSSFGSFNPAQKDRYSDEKLNDSSKLESLNFGDVIEFTHPKDNPAQEPKEGKSETFDDRIISSLFKCFCQFKQKDFKELSKRIFAKWQADEEEAYNSKMNKFIKAYERIHERERMSTRVNLAQVFYQWKEMSKDGNNKTNQDFELFKNSFHSKEYINNTSIRSPEQQHSSQLDLKHLQHRYNKENAFSPEGILKAFTNQPNFEESYKISSHNVEGIGRLVQALDNKYSPCKKQIRRRKSNATSRSISHSVGRNSKYQKFYTERLSRPRQARGPPDFTRKEEEDFQECTFQPDISASKFSDVTSGANKNTTYNGGNNCLSPVSPHDRLYFQGCEKRSKKKYYSKIMGEKDDQECTFHPVTNKSGRKSLRKRSSGLSVYDRLYSEHSHRRSAQRKIEMKKHLENEQMRKFAPDRISKPSDSKFGLEKEPFYEKFNRLYNDHAKKLQKKRVAKQERDAMIEKRSNHSTNSRLSKMKPKSQERIKSKNEFKHPQGIRDLTNEMMSQINNPQRKVYEIVPPKVEISKKIEDTSHNKENKYERYTELALKYKNTINDTKPSTENNTSSLSSTGNFQPLTAFKTSFENYDFNPNSRYNLASQ